jgi:molecular chaperone DnaJ
VELPREIEVGIPAGVDNGVVVRVPGEGEAGDPGSPRGDLLCHIRVKEHSLFRREGVDLICQVPISLSQAALGAEIEVPSLDGPVALNVPRGTQSGDVQRIPRKGMPDLRGGRRQGDLLVQLILETPRNLTKRQEELFRELAELDRKNVQPQQKSFFDKIKTFFTGTEPTQNAGTS